MWCTRWFLPLLLIPLPTASPYFLFLFFFSLTLHARPCFYCIILLTALFTSSCYWQPVPTRTLLSGTFPNISGDGSLYYSPNASISDQGDIPSSQLQPIPYFTRLLDRCWCDLADGHLFDPYNITHWQMSSLSQTLGASKSRSVLIAQEKDSKSPSQRNENGLSIARAWMLRTTSTVKDESLLERHESSNVEPSVNGSARGWFHTALPPAWPFTVPLSFPFFNRRNSSSPVSLLDTKGNATVAKERLLRRRYDLRSHGIDLIVDFGWGRKYG